MMFTYIEMVDGVCNAWVGLSWGEVCNLIDGLRMCGMGASFHVLNHLEEVIFEGWA